MRVFFFNGIEFFNELDKEKIQFFFSKKSRIFFNLSVFSKLGLDVRKITKIIISNPTLDTPNKSCWKGSKDSSIFMWFKLLKYICNNN